MKLKTLKLFSLLFSLVMGIGSASAQTTIYSWVSNGGSDATETGGTASGKIGQNKPNEDAGLHYTLQVASDKAAALKTLNDHALMVLLSRLVTKSQSRAITQRIAIRQFL